MVNNNDNSIGESSAQKVKKPIKKWVKIVVPLVLIILVAGTWLIKGSEIKMKATADSNPDFALEIQGDFSMEKLKSYGLPMIIHFGSEFSVPSKEMMPVLQELNEKYRGDIIIKYVDVVKYKNFTDSNPVRGVIPTQVFYDKDGTAFAFEKLSSYDMNAFIDKNNGTIVFVTHEGGLTEKQLSAIIKEMTAK